MNTVTAYECTYCQNIFRTYEQMQECEELCLQQIREEEAEKNLEAIRHDLQNYVRLNAESVEDICRMTIDVSKQLFAKSPLKTFHLDVRYMHHASNSHSYPINGIGNFRKEEGKPIGYPALFGRISFEYEKESSGFSSDIFSHGGIIGINTGSGGAGRGNQYSYSVTLWLDDFPKIKDKVKESLKNNEDFCKLFAQKLATNVEEIDSDPFVKELDMDIQTLQDRIKELQVQLTNVSKLKRERISVLTLPLQKEVDKAWEKTENDFGIPRPYKTL